MKVAPADNPINDAPRRFAVRIRKAREVMTKISDYNALALSESLGLGRKIILLALLSSKMATNFSPLGSNGTRGRRKPRQTLKVRATSSNAFILTLTLSPIGAEPMGSMLADKAAYSLPMILSLKNTAEIKADLAKQSRRRKIIKNLRGEIARRAAGRFWGPAS